jgi:hypothetical protein
VIRLGKGYAGEVQIAASYIAPDLVLSRQLYFLELISLSLFISSMPERQGSCGREARGRKFKRESKYLHIMESINKCKP